MQGRHEDVVALLPALRKYRVYAEARLAELEAELATRRLAQPAVTPAEVQQIWQGLSTGAREQVPVLSAYVRALLQLNADDEVEGLLRKALARQWDPRLVALYGDIDTKPAALLGRAEVWLGTHAGDPQLLQTLGRLSFRAELWGKARAYLEESVTRQPSAIGYRLLADVYDKLGEPELARHQRERGLELATATSAGRRAFLPAPR